MVLSLSQKVDFFEQSRYRNLGFVVLGMASEVMHGVDVCPTEDAVAALLEFLVDPRLPAKSSTCHSPSQSDVECVAKQVYAAVLLYNYFYRKQHPRLEFLGFESFCKLAVVLRPPLLAYMKFMKISDDTELVDAEKQLSLTERKIMDACDISVNLINASSMEGWPISKVAVLLVDFKKENCFLQFSSITDGVWSLIEKELDSKKSTVDTLGSNNMNKKRRIVRKSFKSEPVVVEYNLQQLAFSAVMEATGISESDLTILESSVVYSLSKEKAATSFYIMQCTQPNNNDIVLPIKDAIYSLQGPLVKRNFGGWMHTSVVEYFHLLPYAGMLSNWLSNKGISLQVQIMGLEMVDKDIIKISDKHYDVGFLKRCDQSHEKGCLMDCRDDKGTSQLSKKNDDDEQFKSNPNTALMKVNEDNRCPVFGVSSDIGMSNVEESSCSGAALVKNEDSGGNKILKIQPSDLSKLISPANGDKKAELIDITMEQVPLPENIGENAADGNNTHNVIASDQDMKLASGHAVVNQECNVDYLIKVNEDNGCPVSGVLGNIGMSNVEECRGSAALTKNEDSGGNINLEVQPSDLSKLNRPTNGDKKAKLINTIMEPVIPPKIKSEDATDGNDIHYVISLDQDKKLASDHSVVNHVSNVDDLDQVHTTKCSKDKDLSETVMRVFIRKSKRLVNDDEGCPVFGVLGNTGMPNVEESRGSFAVLTKNEDRGGNIDLKVQPSDLSKLNSPTNGDNKAELIDPIREPVYFENQGRSVASGSGTDDIISSDLDKKLASDHDAVNRESSLNNLGIVQTSKWSKDKDLSETWLRVFFRKRDRLSLQQRDMEDQIAQCDKVIQTILRGREDELMNNIESFIEGCNDGCPTGVSGERVQQRYRDSPQCIKKTIMSTQNPCQELDDLCFEHNWVLPTYYVSVIEGGFCANVQVKGTDFECSTKGEGCSHPQQARASAAKKMLAKLQREVQ